MAVVGEVQGLLDRGITAADHGYPLPAVEEAVAGRAGGRAPALHMFLGRQAQPLRLGAGGNHQGVREILCAAVAGQAEWSPRDIDVGDVIPDELGADMLGLRLHLFHEPRALDDVTKTGIVFHVRGGGKLSARLDALDDDRAETGAGRVDCSGQAGRA